MARFALPLFGPKPQVTSISPGLPVMLIPMIDTGFHLFLFRNLNETSELL
jgi:hypothetical protein